MDLLSHALIGGLVASAGLHQKYGPVASATMVVANLVPDLDGVLAVAGPRYFFEHHRGPLTHSIGGAILESAALSTIVYLATPLKQPWLLFAISLTGAMLHLLSDLLTPWPIPLFWPVSSRTFSLDLIYFLDPFLLVVLGVSFLATNRWPARGTLVVSLTLVLVVCYLGFRVYGQQAAIRLVKERASSSAIAALPHGLSLATWDVIVQENQNYTYFLVDSLRREVRSSQVIRSASDERIEAISKTSALVQAFLKRSRFPVSFVSKEDNKIIIRWRDVHLMLGGGSVRGAKVILNDREEIIEEKIELNIREGVLATY